MRHKVRIRLEDPWSFSFSAICRVFLWAKWKTRALVFFSSQFPAVSRGFPWAIGKQRVHRLLCNATRRLRSTAFCFARGVESITKIRPPAEPLTDMLARLIQHENWPGPWKGGYVGGWVFVAPLPSKGGALFSDALSEN